MPVAPTAFETRSPFNTYWPASPSFAFQLLEEKIWSSFLEIHSGVLGLVIVLLVFLLPGGLLRLPERFGRLRGRQVAT